jgi:hypothetical protein
MLNGLSKALAKADRAREAQDIEAERLILLDLLHLPDDQANSR